MNKIKTWVVRCIVELHFCLEFLKKVSMNERKKQENEMIRNCCSSEFMHLIIYFFSCLFGQLLALKDYTFSPKFKESCQVDVAKFCGRPKPKNK